MEDDGTRIVIILAPARAENGNRSGSAGQAQHGQREMCGRFGRSRFQHRGRGLQAGTAIRACTGTHGQFGHAAAAIGHGFKDLAISDPIADAHVQGTDSFDWPGWASPFQRE